MKRLMMIIGALMLLISAAYPQSGEPVKFQELNLSGPRLGLTVAPEGSLYDELKERGFNPVLSQFGWHFEYTIHPENTVGPDFVVEFIPMVAGVENGTVLPHINLVMGIRLPNGVEFGLGPNVLFTEDTVHTALIIGMGKSIKYGDVQIPLNFSLATSPRGNRYSFTFGYAINRPKKQGTWGR
ncbi:MAG TPA: hypothetical protein PKV71_05665 [Calditrichia bacterium]|nr:hypothetical protein [Calditrichota bacterium]HQV31341.1 hypothetical protein [Calditrichia bacterium]